MLNYIKKNLEPILIGFTIGSFSLYLLHIISDIIIKIAILNNK